MKSTQELNDQLQTALQKAQIDVLDVGNDAFDRETTQVLWLHPKLDLSELDIFKVVVDVLLVDMEETKPFSVDDRAEEDHVDDTNLKSFKEDKNKEEFCFYSRLCYSSHMMHFVMFF